MLPRPTRPGSLHARPTRLYAEQDQQKPNLRLHRLKDTLATVFDFLGRLWKTLDTEGIYVIDSFPVAACNNIRIRRAKLYQDETYRGYQASKRRYFYGLKIHLIVTSAGQPVERVLTPDSVNDGQVLEGLRLRSATWLGGVCG